MKEALLICHCRQHTTLNGKGLCCCTCHNTSQVLVAVNQHAPTPWSELRVPDFGLHTYTYDASAHPQATEAAAIPRQPDEHDPVTKPNSWQAALHCSNDCQNILANLPMMHSTLSASYCHKLTLACGSACALYCWLSCALSTTLRLTAHALRRAHIMRNASQPVPQPQ
jgi:hypothetical protein